MNSPAFGNNDYEAIVNKVQLREIFFAIDFLYCVSFFKTQAYTLTLFSFLFRRIYQRVSVELSQAVEQDVSVAPRKEDEEPVGFG